MVRAIILRFTIVWVEGPFRQTFSCIVAFSHFACSPYDCFFVIIWPINSVKSYWDHYKSCSDNQKTTCSPHFYYFFFFCFGRGAPTCRTSVSLIWKFFSTFATFYKCQLLLFSTYFLAKYFQLVFFFQSALTSAGKARRANKVIKNLFIKKGAKFAPCDRLSTYQFYNLYSSITSCNSRAFSKRNFAKSFWLEKDIWFKE